MWASGFVEGRTSLGRHRIGACQLALSLTHGVDSQDGGGVIHLGEQAEVLHGGSDRASR